MKNSPWIPILVGVLLVSSVLSAVFAVGYTFAARDARRLQSQAAAIQNHMALINALGVDLVAFSKKDSGVLPLLESAGLIGSTGGTAAKPPGK